MDVGNLHFVQGQFRRIAQDVADLRHDLLSGDDIDAASVAGILDRISQSSDLGLTASTSVDKSIRDLLGH